MGRKQKEANLRIRLYILLARFLTSPLTDDRYRKGLHIPLTDSRPLTACFKILSGGVPTHRLQQRLGVPVRFATRRLSLI